MRFAKVMVLSMMTTLGVQGAVAAVTVAKADFGKLPDGRAAEVYTLKNADLEVGITTYGARIVSLKTKDRDGKVADVVLGYNSVEGYVAEGTAKTYFGAIVGRYGNRIRAGKFTIDGHTYQIPLNNNGNALHGGPHGFDDQLWTGKEIPDGVEMSLVSKDGDMGFPGTLTVHVRYTLVGDALHINYSATTDKPTVTNITNHAYFNLSGEGSGTILDEVLEINADGYTPVDAGLIPVGGVKPVAGTPFDFRKPTEIGARINQPNEQLKIAGGYDHNWVLNGPNGTMKLAAKLYDPKTGPRADRHDHPARRAVLLRQLPRRIVQGGIGRGLWEKLRPLPGDAALSRLAQPACLPQHPAQARRNHALRDGLRIFDAEVKRRLGSSTMASAAARSIGKGTILALILGVSLRPSGAPREA